MALTRLQASAVTLYKTGSIGQGNRVANEWRKRVVETGGQIETDFIKGGLLSVETTNTDTSCGLKVMMNSGTVSAKKRKKEILSE
jgi:hypothetical protein